MNITRAAIQNNRVTVVALIVVFVAGLMSYLNLPRAEDPGFIVRTAQVITYFPGASPERVEQLVTDKLEKVIQEMPEIDFVTSQSKSGVSVVLVNILESYTDMRPIWDDLRRKVDRAAGELPDEAIGPFVNDEFGDVFGTIVTISGDGFSYAELKDIADECRNELLLIHEVAKVEIHGEQDERVFVEYNNARLAEFGLSPFQLKSILEARNIIIPGGQIYTDDEQIVLEPTGNFETLDDLRRTVITLPGRSQVVYLGDLANIHRGYVDPPKSLAHYKGTPCLALAINLREGGNIIDLGEQVLHQVEVFRENYPIGVEFDMVAFQPYYVDKKIKEFAGSLLQAVGIVLVVMLLFLGLRTGLVVASLIPMAMISALLLMSIFGIGLDQMSLASLIIALGMLVDNAIVMSESIMVQMAAGKRPVDAAIASANELRIPLLTSSLTTAAAFLPIFLAESSTGEYTAPLFKVVTITLLCSWLLSLTMTPLFCVRFLKVKQSPEGASYNTRFYRTYRGFLQTLLRHRALSILGILLVFVVAMFGFGFVPNLFFPPDDKPIASAELTLPVGTPLRKTEAMVEQIETFLQTDCTADSVAGRPEGLVDWAAFVGEGAPRYFLSYGPEPPAPEYAYIILNATSKEVLEDDVIPRLARYCTDQFPDLTAKIKMRSLGPPVVDPVAVRISGKDINTLFTLSERVKDRLRKEPGITYIKDDWGVRSKKLVVDINQERAQRAGLSNRDIALSLQTILSGFQTSEFREDDEIIPIIMRSVAADRDDFGKLESHNIYVQATGRSVPLKQVADIDMVWQPSKVLRRDRLRTVTVQAGVAEDANAIAISGIVGDWLADESKSWNVGYRYELGGELETSGKANQSIGEKLPIAFLLIVLLLVTQFNSIRKPIIILLTIPLGLIGVVIGLLVTGSYMGFMTFLGIISLAGIVINNAIVLLDRIKIEQEENGHEAPRAIIEASQRRLRPILLTVATTVGGLLPLWFGAGPMWQPMAIALIFGLIFATVLTLGFVPVLYSILYRVSFRGFTYRG